MVTPVPPRTRPVYPYPKKLTYLKYKQYDYLKFRSYNCGPVSQNVAAAACFGKNVAAACSFQKLLLLQPAATFQNGLQPFVAATAISQLKQLLMLQPFHNSSKTECNRAHNRKPAEYLLASHTKIVASNSILETQHETSILHWEICLKLQTACFQKY